MSRAIPSRDNHENICGLLFDQIDRTKNLEKCWAINVYSNKYRVNLFTRSHDEIYDIERVRITESYFCRLSDDGKLTIVA